MDTKPKPPRIIEPVLHNDGKLRCPWPGLDPLYINYHDTEWGVPERDSRALFEKLILDGFQAGLSWITILRKRDNFRSAFDGFAPEIIAHYTDEKCAALMQDTGIVRNRAKIAASVTSARAYLRTMAEMKAETPLSAKISKELRAKGFNFVGPTIVYAFMQAVGMTNDHLVTCFRHAECAELGQKL